MAQPASIDLDCYGVAGGGSVGARSWAGLPTVDVGRRVVCGTGVLTLGDPCRHCRRGRVVAERLQVRCNSCRAEVGRFGGFADDGPDVRKAVGFVLTALAAEGQPAVSGRSLGDAFWVIAWDGRWGRRVAWEGQTCPNCRIGRLERFAAPEEPTESLVCSQSACGSGLEICGPAYDADKVQLAMWKTIPLRPSPPAGRHGLAGSGWRQAQ